MNIKALERAFRKEAMRLMQSISQQNLYKDMTKQVDESLRRIEKDYEKETLPNRPTIKETGQKKKNKDNLPKE